MGVPGAAADAGPGGDDPLLCLYANVMGILGGMVVGVGLLNIGFIEYYNETAKAVGLWNLSIGLFSGFGSA